jgi:hypothetical protein
MTFKMEVVPAPHGRAHGKWTRVVNKMRELAPTGQAVRIECERADLHRAQGAIYRKALRHPGERHHVTYRDGALYCWTTLEEQP